MKTTAKEFGVFKAECERLIPTLGLNGWTFYFKHTFAKDTYARTHTDTITKVCSIIFSTEWDDNGGAHPATKQAVERVAKHEMAHALLADLYSLARSRYVQTDELDEAEHRVVRVLEKLL